MFSRFHLSRLQIGIADVLFVFFTFAIMQQATQSMMDDPGLGWHLRIPDLMVEQGGFVYSEYFSFPTEGNRWVTRAWLSDVIMRLAYGWGGLTAVALLTSMVAALTMRLIYRRLIIDGVHPAISLLATAAAATGLVTAFVARPNIVSILGVWLVADLCQRFHTGKINHKQLFWIIPIILLWTNMHGGFMAGLVLLVLAWCVEAGLALLSWKQTIRVAARKRVLWFTLVGIACGVATLANPNGFYLHIYNFQAVTDSFIQNHTTTEWLPPDFRLDGWFNIERLILALPLLAATCRRRVNLMGLVMTVAWLHLALVSRRYGAIWVVIAIPTLCELTVSNPWLVKAARKLRSSVSEDLRSFFNARDQDGDSFRASFGIAIILMLGSAWLPRLAGHNQEHMPTASLDRFLDLADGRPTFHSANWGGYLTWKGWNRPVRFKTWIDDRIEVHGEGHLREYYSILAAEPGWERKLMSKKAQWICIPVETRLSTELRSSSEWQNVFVDDYVAVYRRNTDPMLSVVQ